MSNDQIIDEESQEFEESDMDESDDESEEEEESYIETLARETIIEYEDRLGDYVDEPETPEETTQNESIKKFIVQKARKRLLDSLVEHFNWVDDTDLASMMKKFKKAADKDEEIESSAAMKRIIKETSTIAEVVE